MKLLNKLSEWYKHSMFRSVWKWCLRQAGEVAIPIFKSYKHFSVIGLIFAYPILIFGALLYSSGPTLVALIFTCIWLFVKLIIMPIVWLFNKIFIKKDAEFTQ